MSVQERERELRTFDFEPWSDYARDLTQAIRTFADPPALAGA